MGRKLIVYQDSDGGRPLRRGALVSVATGFLAGLAAVLLVATPAAAAAVNVVDDSHVLDVARVQNEAATLPDPVAIYTTTKLADDKAAFDRETQSKVSGPTVIVIAINTQSRHLAIRSGPRSRVTQTDARTATDAFTSSFRGNSDYTAATIAALDSMRSAIARSGSRTSGNGSTRTSHRTTPATYLSGCVCLLLVAAVIGLIVFLVRRSGGRRRAARRGGPGGYGPGGYGPAGYDAPGYGQPGYGSSGVNPWVAGGAGAVAGGVLGYELGRMEGEHEQRQRDDYDDRGGGGYDGDYGGGGADADFGGGGDSGGGGGGSDSGGSGDF
jgi:hypothetical protein